MARTVTWLHLSDLHACVPRRGWDARRVLEALLADLHLLRDRHGLRPQLVFFTGDAAYGQIGTRKGEAIIDQFREADDFFTAVREDLGVEARNLFVVPGNHDVNIQRITRFQTAGIQAFTALEDVERLVHEASEDWRELTGRLEDYRRFLDSHGYEHLLQDRDRLIYLHEREVGGARVAVAGFNTAWSARGVGREEAGRLWMAGRYQLEVLCSQISSHVDFRIALLHHPPSWLVPEESTSFGRQLEGDFEFVLHGHEHASWVRTDPETGHCVLSAGACHEWSESEANGYSVVEVDLDAGKGRVWLRRYDPTGRGWVPRSIYGKTDELGRWSLDHLGPWISAPRGGAKVEPGGPPPREGAGRGGVSATEQALRYEDRYRQSVVDGLDYVQLFGADVPREAKEYSLSVAYVSLSLASDDEPELEAEGEDDGEGECLSLPASEVFDTLGRARSRLLIRGPAGSGKTTLLRWAAVQAGRGPGSDGSCDEDERLDDIPANLDEVRPWRESVPFRIRLRDCARGVLPRPRDFPLLLAKQLDDPPEGWMDEVLTSGRALIMFDGADEVPVKYRDTILRDIRHLIQTYPDNYYIVTTRPEAVERLEFAALGFSMARVEPLAPRERDVFIDRWHDAMELRLRQWGEAVDLRPLAARLKRRLQETPAITRLTVNPLLCAVVCAIHRQRNENLPETPVRLCEVLCEMLLDRRDKERPGGPEVSIDETYSRLPFDRRKGLLSAIAYSMISDGISAIDEDAADELIASELQGFGFTKLDARRVRRALVERSGMLQESSEASIEFLHNTLKEYLAAARFVNIGDYDVLAEHADDPSWQPVILFTVALPRDGSSFATELVRAIYARTPRDAKARSRTKADLARATKLRSQQFFFFRCYSNAYDIRDEKLAKGFDAVRKQLLPPRTMTDAESLAPCGDAIVPYLKNDPHLRAPARAACVRTLRLIGTPRALRCIESYHDDDTATVNREIVLTFSDPLDVPAVGRHIHDTGFVPDWVDRMQIDIEKLCHHPRLLVFRTPYYRARTLEPLRELTRLRRLDIRGGELADIADIANLVNLNVLHLLNLASLTDISAVGQLRQLTELRLFRTGVRSVAPIARLSQLQRLHLSSVSAVDCSKVLGRLTELRELALHNLGIVDLGPMSSPELEKLTIRWTKIRNIDALSRMPKLTVLDLNGTNTLTLEFAAELPALNTLSLLETHGLSLWPLAEHPSLTMLHLSVPRVESLDPLVSIPNLSVLNLHGPLDIDLSPLAHIPRLRWVRARATPSELGALKEMLSPKVTVRAIS